MESGAVFQKSPWKAIFSLCVPAMVSILVMMLYNMADMYFVGWLGDYAQVASVSLAGPVFSVLMGISTMIGNGGCTKIAQALGRKDLEQVRKDSALCVWASLVSGVVFAAACVIFCDSLLRFLGVNEDNFPAGRCSVQARKNVADRPFAALRRGSDVFLHADDLRNLHRQSELRHPGCRDRCDHHGFPHF